MLGSYRNSSATLNNKCAILLNEKHFKCQGVPGRGQGHLRLEADLDAPELKSSMEKVGEAVFEKVFASALGPSQ
jgi:hypothetical protein